MERVWALTTGSYSDYRVQAVFATKKQADHASTMRDDATVEEMWYYPEDSDAPVQHRVYRHSVNLWDDGSTSEERNYSDLQWEYDPWDSRYMQTRPYVRFVRAPVHKNKGGRLEVTGLDEEACLKAMSDYVAQWKAQGHRLNEMNR